MKFEKLATNGFEVFSSVLDDTEIREFRNEVDRLVGEAGTACLRNVCERSVALAGLARSRKINRLIGERFVLVRSLLFDKSPESNWPVAWHQDLTIEVKERHDVPGFGPWSVKDGSPHVHAPASLLEQMVAARIHLDDTPAENGALHVVPGSHRLGRVSSEAFRNVDQADAVTCDCRAGDVLLMSPLILHSSRRSLEPSRRRVLHFEYAKRGSLEEPLVWAV